MEGKQETIITGQEALGTPTPHHQPKKTIKGSVVVADVRSGLTFDEIRSKYDLTATQLKKCFQALVAQGFLRPNQIPLASEESTIQMYPCPACRAPNSVGTEICTQCGVIMAKYVRLQETKTKLTPPQTEPTKTVFQRFMTAWDRPHIMIPAIIIPSLLIPALLYFSPFTYYEKHKIYKCATEEVARHLKSPATAKFSPYSETLIAEDGSVGYLVGGWVDAQNSYGAILRSRFHVKVYGSGGRYSVQEPFFFDSK